jgi:RHS repeat-associated protein
MLRLNFSRKSGLRLMASVLACCSFFVQASYAQQGRISQDYVNRLSGAAGEVITNATVSLTYQPAGEQSVLIKNIVTLSLNEESPQYLSDNFTESVTVQVNYGASAASTNSLQQTLTVTYNKAGGVTYNPKNYLSFTGAQYVQVTVLSVSAAPLSNGVDPTTLLTLQNEMLVWRTYQLATTANTLAPAITATPPPATPIPDQLPISWQWPSGAGNNATQLEWTWLENELASDYTQNGTLNTTLLFTHNATRVILPINVTNYNIPLFYDGQGVLYYRMRAVNNNSSGSESDGPWSAVQSFAFGGHNNNLNWQVTTTYAEGGKRNTIMRYSDGTLRERQTVTKDNTTNTTVTAETFYDGQGRAAVQLLPAPGINSILAYTQNLNLFNGQAPNSNPAAFFDLQPVSGPNTTPPMVTDTGTAHYYDPSNPLIAAGDNQNLPNGGGYPYSVTWYTPDGTSRVMVKSGVGPALQMGSNHETKYYYGSAAQEELDGLFGTEAGDYTHYFKNMVQDANGQMTVSYVDMHGWTIATALAGNTTDSIRALNLNATQYPGQAGTTISRNLLNGNSNTVRDNSIESLTTLLVPATTAYQFNYSLNPQALQLAQCNNTPVCYGCMYNLQITITDESGNTAPIIREFDNVSLSAGNSCTAPPFEDDHYMGNVSTVSSNDIQFSATLLPGSYSVRKTLTVSQASLQTFQAQYAQLGQCDSLQGLIDSVYQALLPTSNCNVASTTTPCQSCMTALGTYAAFKSSYIATLNSSQQPSDAAIHAVYSADSANCVNLCTTSSHTLATLQAEMLADMMPYSGQYAQNPATATQGTMYNKYNIFSTAGTGTSTQPYYIYPMTSIRGAGYYYDAGGNIDLTIQPNPSSPSTLLSPLNPSIFTTLFAASWAQALLPYHPEYAQLQFAQQNLSASYNWIDNFTQIVTLAGAIDSGYTSSTGHSETLDPFFTLANTSTAESAMSNLETTGAYYNNLSLWQIAYGNVACSTITNPASLDACYQGAPTAPTGSLFASLTTAQQNQVWSTFQGLYIAERDSMVNAYINANSPDADANNLVSQGYILRFPVSNSQVASQYQWTGFPTTPGAAPAVNMADSVTYIDTSRCGSYIASWAAVLSQCPAIIGNPDSATIIQQITAGMETVCEKGQNEANPWGSSSVAPSYPQDGTPRSFSAVIAAVFAAYNIPVGQYCNPFVITSPKPYGENPVLTPEMMTTVDSCACNQFAAISQAATTAGYNPASLSSLNAYLEATYQDSLTQVVYNGLQQCSVLGTQGCRNESTTVTYLCSAGSPCGAKDAVARKAASTTVASVAKPDATVPGDSCTTTCTTQVCNPIWYIYLASPQHKPAFLDCGFTGNPGCITCAQLSALISSYKTYFAGQACDSAPLLDTTNLTPAEIGYNVTFANYVNYQTGLQLNWITYVQDAAASGCNLANYASNTGTQTVICPSLNPLTDTAGLLTVDSSCSRVHDMAVAIAQSIYQQRQAQLLANFSSAYSSRCLSAAAIEQFTVTYTTSEYQYTLYYYDQAGNLVKTIPPKGARPNFSASFISSVEAARISGTEVVPSHLFATNYRYNSLNAVIAQQTPDAGVSNFWYDLVGRLAVSQNAQQASAGNYSYTIYDALGRITQVGQKPQTTAMTQTISQSSTALNSWINSSGGTNAQITGMVYDNPVGFSLAPMLSQANLRNRISYTYTQALATSASWYTATFYSYDVHGNVDTLLQDYLGVTAMGTANQYKRICYAYDLVSGKVNGVDYQPGGSDAFYHRYQYDAQNRVVQVLTSRDSITWEQDASYDYYKHGPMSRLVLGQLQTQQVDYSYTLQGWLKGVNIGGPFNGAADSVAAANAVTIDSTVTKVTDSTGISCPAGTAIANAFIKSRPATGGPPQYTALNSITFEPGFSTGTNDAMTTLISPGLATCTPATIPTSTAENTLPDAPPVIPLSYPIAQDAYSFSLHYYPGDYTPIGPTTTVVDMLAAIPTYASPMFNGNIGAMAVNLPAVGNPLVYNYHYDQLNRMVQMDAFSGWNPVNNTFAPVIMPDYQERATFDPNGNINTYVRHGYAAAGIPMDSLTYTYYSNNNQLSLINNGVTSNYITDLKDQGTGNNYTYDLIGNLKQDLANGVTNIDWTVYGKIADITNGSGTITYTYDAAANRITKLTGGVTSVYVRDASGNILSIYTQSGSGAAQQSEVDLYGSSRLGSVGSLTVPTSSISLSGGLGTATLSTFSRGEKFFELGNQLDNILQTITDKKIAVPSTTNNTLIDHFTADIATAQDYYPFGMLMPGRTFIASTTASYRYGFNGKENDNEVKGVGDQVNYGMRGYDPRVGRFLSVDPMTKKYAYYTPYQFAGNSPIEFIDRDGMEPWRNPHFPGVGELYGMFVVDNILEKADDNYHKEESGWFKRDPVLKGVYYCGPNSTDDGTKYITDTKGDPNNLFNMKVSNSTKFYVDESNAKDYDNYERAVTLGLLENFVSGQGAENYVFPKNGIISSKFLQSDVLKDALQKYMLAPSKVYSDQSNFGLWDLTKDAFRNGTLTGSITGFVGSAMVTISPNEKGVDISIFNITSLYSGTLGKETPIVGKYLTPTSYVRWQDNSITPYGNISQTFQLFIPYNTTGDKYKNIKDVISDGEYDQP